ncbi:hypothetical protein D3C76_1081230 [compost metagenome]
MHHALRQCFTGGRAYLEAGAGKAEAMQQARLVQAGAEHRFVIRQVALGAAPGSNGLGAGQCRVQFGGVAQDVEHCGLPRACGGRGQGKTAPAAQHAVATRHLAGIDAAAFDPGAGGHEQRQRLGDQHGWVGCGQRHRLAEPLGQLRRPGAGAIQQPGRLEALAAAGVYAEAVAVVSHLHYLALLMHLGAAAPGRLGEGR